MEMAAMLILGVPSDGILLGAIVGQVVGKLLGNAIACSACSPEAVWQRAGVAQQAAVHPDIREASVG